MLSNTKTVTSRIYEPWFVLEYENALPHFVPRALVDVLHAVLASGPSRSEPRYADKDCPIYDLDFEMSRGARLDAGRFVHVFADGLEFRLAWCDAETFAARLASANGIRAQGHTYFAVCGRQDVVVLTPEQRDELLAAIPDAIAERYAAVELTKTLLARAEQRVAAAAAARMTAVAQ